ncbi:sigma-E factor negative regulatory protein [Shewanella intestini]|uniref:Anti-sigma-E factor RseA n=1 Tax=Shewanella intestini TaxID=2017544 RepID=A0ABS5HY03_9GAMM|nr:MULTISPECIES: RseA family anti-sigma factor [Shewanella]MBR9726645.1 anti-sigma factor [Shewanella intestini]MRG34789.1 anti-sigma factor [Shewanella sp. XMDDZSB0408]
MLKTNQEWISEVVDGEADANAVSAMASDTSTHEQWQRYHLIGDAMRGELPEKIDLDLTASIAAAIDLEPTVIAPKASPAIELPEQKSNVVPFFKQFGQYAIAASVALVAILSVYQTPSEDESPLPVLNTRPLVGSVSPVSYQTGAAQEQNNENLIEQRRRVNTYIQDHMLQQRLNPSVVNQPADKQ